MSEGPRTIPSSDWVDKRFGSLVGIHPVDRVSDRGRRFGLFVCDCGRKVECPIGRVMTGYKKHCGCKTVWSRPKHAMHGTPTYRSWQAMKFRCLNPRSKDYHRYGARGIKIHPAWIDSFEAFLADVGVRPPRTSIDRIDTTGDYVPGNVRWATNSEQACNRPTSYVVTINSVAYPSAEEAARVLGVSSIQIARSCDGYVDRRRSTKRIPPRPGFSRHLLYGGVA